MDRYEYQRDCMFDFWSSCCSSHNPDLTKYVTFDDLDEVISGISGSSYDDSEVRSQIQALQGAIITTTDTLSTKADLSALTATNEVVAVLQQHSGDTTPVDLSNYYTKTEVDERIDIPKHMTTVEMNAYTFPDDTTAVLTVNINGGSKLDTVTITGYTNDEFFEDIYELYLLSNPPRINGGNDYGFGEIVNGKLVITVPNGYITDFDGGSYQTISVEEVKYASGTPSTVIPEIQIDLDDMEDRIDAAASMATSAGNQASTAYSNAIKALTALTTANKESSGYSVTIIGTNNTGGTKNANVYLNDGLYSPDGSSISLDYDNRVKANLRNGATTLFWSDENGQVHSINPFDGGSYGFVRINGQPIIREGQASNISITGTVDTALITQMQQEIANLQARVTALESGGTPTPDTGDTPTTYAAIITYSNGTTRNIPYTGSGFINEAQTFPTGTDRTGVTAVIVYGVVYGLGADTFSNCPNLATVTMYDGLESIGVDCFKNDTSLISINIPSTVTSISETAFDGCSNLGMFTFNSLTPPTVVNSGYERLFTYATSIMVPMNALTAYQTAWPNVSGKIRGF